MTLLLTEVVRAPVAAALREDDVAVAAAEAVPPLSRLERWKLGFFLMVVCAVIAAVERLPRQGLLHPVTKPGAAA
jgi:hypothetical protein